MNSFIIAVNAVLPIVLLVVFGYFLRKSGYFDKNTTAKLNKACFMIFLPFLTFSNIIHADIGNLMDVRLAVYAVSSILISVFLLVIIVNSFEKDKKKVGTLIQGIYRSNFVILGLPLATHIAGEKASAITSMLIMIVIPVYNFLAVCILAYYGGQSVNKKDILLSIAKNTMIIASLLAIVVSVTGIKLPKFLDKTVTDIAKLGSVLPIVVLGATLDIKKISDNVKNIIIAVVGKLIFMPVVFLIPAIVFMKFSPDKIVSLIALYGSPTAVASAVMAEQLGCDYELASSIVIFSTICSCVTIFLWTFILSFLSVI